MYEAAVEQNKYSAIHGCHNAQCVTITPGTLLLGSISGAGGFGHNSVARMGGFDDTLHAGMEEHCARPC